MSTYSPAKRVEGKLVSKTSKEHYEKYKELQIQTGVLLFDDFMGKTKEDWIRLYEQDEHLNNVPMVYWDSAA